jgi:plastocyanin
VELPGRRRRARFVVLAFAIGLAACGGGAPSTAPGPPTPTAVPGAAGSGEALAPDLAVTAENLAFSPVALVGPAGVPLTITMRNRDAGIPHGISIRAGAPVADAVPNGPDLFDGEITAGPTTVVSTVPALPPGIYTIYCPVHPNMVVTLTLR